MIIDVHVHENKYSLDSTFNLQEAVASAKKIGLDALCITDHESNEIMEEAHEYSKKNNFLILVGAEILTYEGDLLVFGLNDIPKHKMHAGELMDIVLKKGGIAISAHPYRNNNRGMGDYIREAVKLGLSGVEAFNGSTEPHQNLYAYALATELGLPSFGASDAHLTSKIGKYATVIPNGVRDERDFIEVVKSKELHPAIYRDGKFQKINIYSTFSDDKDLIV